MGSAVVLAIGWLFFGCEYEVPITEQPTRKIDEKLVGDWVIKDGEKEEVMKVAKLDDSTYIVFYDDRLYRAYHSDVGKTQLVSVQTIDSEERKYSYIAWKLSPDGKSLGLQIVNDEIIPDATKDSATLRDTFAKEFAEPQTFQTGSKVQPRERKSTQNAVKAPSGIQR